MLVTYQQNDPSVTAECLAVYLVGAAEESIR